MIKKFLIVISIICVSVLLIFVIRQFINNQKNDELYTISFDSNGGSEVSSITLTQGSPLTLPIPEKFGNTFIGWYKDQTLTVKFTNETMPNSNRTLYAKWEAVKFKVTYECNGGSKIADELYEYNSVIKRPEDPIRPGYSFLGWYSDINLTKEYEFGLMPLEDIKIYAKWNANQATISFDSFGGTEVETISQIYNTNITKPNDPTKFGYHFGGWYTDKNYKNKYEFTTMPAESITLYAKWNLISEGLIFYKLPSNTYSVTGYEGSSLDVIIPEDYNNLPVTKIDLNKTLNIKSLYISKSVSNIVNIYTNDNLININVDAENIFYSSVNGVLFNKDQTMLIKYPTGRADIYEIPNTVTTIGKQAFYLGEIVGVTIPNSVITIAHGAFSSTRNLSIVNFEENSNLDRISDSAFYNSNINSIVIPRSVTMIGLRAFAYTYSLNSITFENDSLLESIDTQAFLFSNITSITIPRSVKVLGYGVFSNANKLTEVLFESDSQLSIISNSAFEYTFSLTNITIPKSVTMIGERVFSGTDNLKTISFEEGSQLTMIGDNAFNLANGITEIRIPEGVTTIGKNAFSNAYNLVDVYLPSTLTLIDANAFEGANSLRGLILNSINPPTFIEQILDYNTMIYVPNESLETYKSASGWSNYAHRIQPITNQ